MAKIYGKMLITYHHRNADENHLFGLLLTKSRKMTTVGKDVEKQKCLSIVGKNIN
jgi:hypothetical protein